MAHIGIWMSTTLGKDMEEKAHQIYDHVKLLREIDKADSISLRHYRETYTDPIYPPSWDGD